MNDRFNWIIKFVLDAEGGYTNDAADPGGETNFGIDKRSHPGVDIKHITEQQAKEIYWNEYWLKFGCDAFKAPVGEVYFDCCVNTGATQSNKFLQRAVGTEADGIIGPKTAASILAADPRILANAIIDQRQRFYKNLAEKRPTLHKFLQGWTNRNNNLRRYIDKV
jgi:lysozyme family protein